jgi:hypothetical protein
MRPLQASAVLCLLLLAGCAQPSADPAPDCASAAASPDCGTACTAASCSATQQPTRPLRPSPKTTDVPVYKFSGLVAGANPPGGSGPLAPGPVPVAKHDTFKVPERTLDLVFSVRHQDGTAVAQVYVTGPDGSLVYSSGETECVGSPPPAGAACVIGAEEATGGVDPGEYAIDYCVTGVTDVVVEVVATVNATA